MIVLFNKDWLSRGIDKSELPTDRGENGGLGPGMGCFGETATGGVNTRLDGKLGVGRKSFRNINLEEVAGPDYGTDRRGTQYLATSHYRRFGWCAGGAIRHNVTTGN